MEVISKELLSEVLELEMNNYPIVTFTSNNSYITLSHRGLVSADIRINIYELAYKCKEWAKSNLFSYMNIGTISETRAKLDLRTKFNFGIWRGYSCNVVTIDERHRTLHSTKCYESETESIFKACQWILDNKVNK